PRSAASSGTWPHPRTRPTRTRRRRPGRLPEVDVSDSTPPDPQTCETLAPATGFVMTRRLWQGWRVRTGATYVAALRDGRAVYLDGERVKDVTSHPAFAEPIRRIAEIYDHARSAEADPALTFADPATGRSEERRVGKGW